MNNLARLYNDQGKYEQAEPLLERALAVRERQLGAEHPNTARCRWVLATLYEIQGKLSNTQVLYQQALSVLQERFGPQYPQTRALRKQYEAFLRHRQS